MIGDKMTDTTSFIMTLSNLDDVTKNRKNALRTEINLPDGLWIIDTVYAIDTQEIETGIWNKNRYDNWVIVEQYGIDEKIAKEGHGKWTNAVKNGKKEFVDVVNYGF
jgi:hypothetical protein